MSLIFILFPSINPRQAKVSAREARQLEILEESGDNLDCHTHTVTIGGLCWVMCDEVRMWRCGQPILKINGLKPVG